LYARSPVAGPRAVPDAWGEPTFAVFRGDDSITDVRPGVNPADNVIMLCC